jgi:phytoene dehydrogenase-like protein
LGGDVVTDTMVRSRADIPSSRLLLLDLDPRQVARVLRDDLPSGYARRLGSFRHGPGVFKVDWALDGPVPWSDPAVASAGTVHLGGTYGEVAAAEKAVASGRIPQRPFVLFVQASVADASRAHGEAQTAWAYCHVPNGSTVDMTAAIEAQVERFAPGFLDRVLARNVMNPAAMRQHNPNYVGGDIGGGAADLRQFITRPVASRSPWRTPVSGVYLASASTPPGAGVHGMGGWIAARTALADLGDADVER